MSINVTVKGDPINIQTGAKMVTASPNHSKKEFERRRLIRLSQVRQQSKHIAETVRNRVKKQKLQQVEELEKEGQKKLKQWQAKKLSELQSQYHDALRDLGAGHKEASLLRDEKEILDEKMEHYEKVAEERGALALQKLKETQAKSVASSNNVEHKKSEVSQLNGAVKKASLRNESHGSLQVNASKTVTESNSDAKIVNNCNSPKKTDKLSVLYEETCVPEQKRFEEIHEERLLNTPISVVPSSEHQNKELLPTIDTRISERIMRRSVQNLLEPDVCDTFPKNCGNTNCGKAPSQNTAQTIQQNIYSCSCTKQPSACHCPTPSPKVQRPRVSSIKDFACVDFTDEEPKITNNLHPQPRSKEIPIKPRVMLRSTDSKKGIVQQDLKGKHGKTKVFTTQVEKIGEDSLIISPEEMHKTNEYKIMEKIRTRDMEALLRGQKAMERERLQREYNELMRKLPALQKLERLCELKRDKPEHHMTEERIREQERKKQSILDNTYEKLFPDERPPTITIPVKNQNKNKKRLDAVSDSDSATLNLGTLEKPKKKPSRLYTEDEVETILQEGRLPPDSKFKAAQLKSVLEKLRKQKEELLKEIQNLSDEEAGEFCKILPSKSSKSQSVQVESKSKAAFSTSSSECVPTTKKSSSDSAKTAKTQSKSVQVNTKPKRSKSKSPRNKKRKPEKDVVSSSSEQLADQKTSRETVNVKSQASKKIKHSENAPLNSLVNKASSTEETHHQAVSCDCTSGKLCEIVIRIKDGKSSEVLVKKDSGKLAEKTKKKSDERSKSLRSWHEKLKNNSVVSNSSTSYMSPPILPNKEAAKAPPYFCELLSKKPQQVGLNEFCCSPPTKGDKRLFEDIKRLLVMSRLSIDELEVSSVSTVTTPSQSVIYLESNTDITKRNVTDSCGTHLTSDINKVTSSNESNEAYPDILGKYAKIADQCSQRISKLSAMIEKVREEKNKMLQTNTLLSNTSSTRYIDLPTPQQSFNCSDNTSISDDLLKINLSLAEKLKGLTPQEIREYAEKLNISKDEEELAQRLQNLQEASAQSKTETTKDKPANNFILSDIPKMPPLNNTAGGTVGGKARKPPPSMGVRKLGEIGVPHELSTIPEQDSQSKLEPTKEKCVPTPKSTQSIQTQNARLEITKRPKIKKTLREKLTFSDGSPNSSSTSSDEKLEMFRIETMLHNIGMDWAISTLRKTQEALALTSSTSSVDINGSPKIQEINEKDIRDYLSRQIFQRISSSTLKSDVSPGSLNETQDSSVIDFSRKQTSTPIEKSRDSAEKNSTQKSEIKDFFSLPDQTL